MRFEENFTNIMKIISTVSSNANAPFMHKVMKNGVEPLKQVYNDALWSRIEKKTEKIAIYSFTFPQARE